MITYVQGDLFKSPAQTLVNTVNTFGVMGKGVAKEFKRLYPEMFKKYVELCESDQLKIGSLFLYKSQNKWILNFPTKEHWRNPSKVEYIEAGLKKFIEIYDKWEIHSIAFPPLGCGNGQLDFEKQVKPVMEKYLNKIPIDSFIYPDRNDPYEPEQSTPKKMKEWLNTEPEVLSFKEVWWDINNKLNEKSEFRTVSNGHPFTATINPRSKKQIKIVSGKNELNIEYEELLHFWAQLRKYGFTLKNIVTADLSRKIYYIIPILSELPYIKLVRLSESYDSFRVRGSVGLQYLNYMVTNNKPVKQLSLGL